MTRVAVACLVVAGALAGCAPRTPPYATAIDANRANVELAELEQGRALTIRKCGGCHQTPMPHDHTAAEWPTKLDEMAARANLDLRQRHAIEQYLVVMSDAPVAAAKR
jgi:nitrate/TMAO reductase-like tetraheme cytochrome c subunit